MPFTAHPHRKRDLARTVLSRLRAGQALVGVTDQRITPVLLADAVEAIRQLAEQRVSGTVHVAPTTWTTPHEFVSGIAIRMGYSQELIEPQTFAQFSTQRPAQRPQHSWLDVSKARALTGGTLRSVDEQLDAWAAQALLVPGQA
jgi:dTDP-4-dehydrorhamnose reductase